MTPIRIFCHTFPPGGYWSTIVNKMSVIAYSNAYSYFLVELEHKIESVQTQLSSAFNI